MDGFGIIDPSAPGPGHSLIDIYAAEDDGRRKALDLLRDALTRRDGKPLTADYIAARTIVLYKLCVDDPRSLRHFAQQLGFSTSSLSQIATEFSEKLNTTALWQRPNARWAYRLRALGVHAGTWQVTPKWERRQLKAKLTRRTAALLRNAGEKPKEGGHPA